MNISKPIRFREEERSKELTFKEVAKKIKPRFRRMLGYAGRKLVRR